MDEKTKLILAQMQINNLVELLKDNQFERYLYSHLITIDVELKRQLTHHEWRRIQISSKKYADDAEQ